MQLTYQINSIQGTSPFNIYVCDGCGSQDTCVFISSITTNNLPYVFDIPTIFQNANQYCIKVVDREDCETCYCINQTQTPTPTNSTTTTPTTTPTITTTPTTTPTISTTPTITPTISTTPTITPTISITPTITPTISITPTITPTISITPESTTTPTPTISTSQEILTATIEASYQPSGLWTIVEYTFNLSRPTINAAINTYFDDWIYENNGNYTINDTGFITIRKGDQSGSIGKIIYKDYNSLSQYSEFKGINFNYYDLEPNFNSNDYIQSYTTGYTYEPYVTPTVTPTISLTPTLTNTPTVTITNTPTLSPSVTTTNTPTPSVTNNDLDINFNTTVDSGSTVVSYTFTSNKQVTQDTTVNFTNTLLRSDNSEVQFNSSVTIPSGTNQGTNTVTLTNTDYTDLIPWYISYTDITTSGDYVNRVKPYYSVDFINDDSPIYQPYIFIGCCNGYGNKNLLVTSEAVSSGGWVDSGMGLIIDGKCFIPYGPGGDGSDGYAYGPQISGCRDQRCAPCPSVTPTPSTTPLQYGNYKLVSCCDYSILYVDLASYDNLQVDDYISYNSECWVIGAIEESSTATDIISGTFENCEQCLLVQSCPSVTPTPTPSSTPCVLDCSTSATTECILDCSTTGLTDCILDCSTEIGDFYPHRAERCCTGPNGETIYTELMIPSNVTTTDIVIYDGYCWLIGGTSGENENILLDDTVYSSCTECLQIAPCDNPITPSVTPTISVTPSITPTITITPSITPSTSTQIGGYTNYILANCETGLDPIVVEINDNLQPLNTNQGIILEAGKCYNIVSPGGTNPEQTLDSLIDNVCQNCPS
jgi:hypothetical protein